MKKNLYGLNCFGSSIPIDAPTSCIPSGIPQKSDCESWIGQKGSLMNEIAPCNKIPSNIATARKASRS